MKRSGKQLGESLLLDVDRQFMHNIQMHASDLGITLSHVALLGMGWYVTDLADAYRPLQMEELPPLQPAPATSMWTERNHLSIVIPVQDSDFNSFKTLALQESLTTENLAIKSTTCYLFNLRADEKDLDEIRSRYDHLRDEFGFVRPRQPQPDPRSSGH